MLDSYSQAPECRQSATVDAFCRQWVVGGAFYGALFVPWLAGCCCKSCVIHKKQVILSARFHFYKPQRHTNRVWPTAIPPCNSFLYQTALLSTPPLLSSLPQLLLPLHKAHDVVFFALVFDCPPWEVPGSGCMWQAVVWTRPSPPLFTLRGHSAWELQYPRGCAPGWLFKCCG